MPAVQPQAALPPRYRVVRHIANGGMAAVWAAEDELTACKGELLDAIGTGQRAVCERQRIATRTVRDGHTYSLMPARTRRNAR